MFEKLERNLSFPPIFRKRLEQSRRPGDKRTDREVLAGSTNILEAIADPSAKVTVRRRRKPAKK